MRTTLAIPRAGVRSLPPAPRCALTASTARTRPATTRATQVIAATNRPDVLDPALMRSGRLDRKIELPHPTEDARARILQIHSRKMNLTRGIDLKKVTGM